MKDNQSRSIIKTITWRILGTVITFIIVFIATGKLTISLIAGGLEIISKLILYYLHERVWNKVKWGKND